MKLPSLPMTRTRRIAAFAVIGVLALSSVAYAVVESNDDEPGERAVSSTTTTSTTSTSTTTTSTTLAPSTTTVPDDGSLRSGSAGPAVQALQQRLLDLKFDPGPIDGRFGLATMYAVQAFEKLNGMSPDGRVGLAEQAALANPAAIVPLAPDGGANRTEVDLARQVMHIYQGGALRLTTHVSTGNNQRFCNEGKCDTAITPIGSFRYSWRATGWHEAPLGKLHNPVFFTSNGVAVHGSLSVPTYPASHGCVRIPMHISQYFPSLVKRGDPVYVTDGRPVGPPPVAPEAPPSTLKPTTPGDDPSTTTTTAPPTTTTTPSTTTTTTTVTIL
jgi:peptidoglycan hydrolase-like protein with peptidoglycan-binding domain